MPWTKKEKPHLVRNVVISSEAFVYITENKRNSREHIYQTLDRILEEHERLTSDRNND
jgi:hypothetical protein